MKALNATLALTLLSGAACAPITSPSTAPEPNTKAQCTYEANRTVYMQRCGIDLLLVKGASYKVDFDTKQLVQLADGATTHDYLGQSCTMTIKGGELQEQACRFAGAVATTQSGLRAQAMTSAFVTELNQVRLEYTEGLDPAPINAEARVEVEDFVEQTRIRLDLSFDKLMHAVALYYDAQIENPAELVTNE